MIVKYVGETDPLALINGKEYEVMGICSGMYRIVDEEGTYDDEEIAGYLYDPDSFEIVSGSPDEFADEYEG